MPNFAIRSSIIPSGMANNTAMIVNSLMTNTPIHTSQSVEGIPAIYSKITVITKDSY